MPSKFFLWIYYLFIFLLIKIILIIDNLRNIIFNKCVKFGGEKEFQKMFHLLENPKTEQDPSDAIAAMASTDDEGRLQMILDMIKRGKFKDQVWSYLLLSLFLSNF